MNIELRELPENPDSTARCPKCKKLVRCHMLEYVKMNWKHQMKLYHKECGTTWLFDINKGKSTILDKE